jgi:YD repeat-containing protein
MMLATILRTVLYLFTFTSFYVAISQEKLIPNDLEEFKLKGKVKSVNNTSCTFYPQKDSTFEKQCEKGSTYFNLRGQIITETESFYKVVSSYDSRGRLVSVKKSSFKEKDASVTNCKYINNTKIETGYRNGEPGLSFYTKYDGKGNVIEFSIKGIDSIVRVLKKFSYDKKGRVIQQLNYEQFTHEITNNITKQYDANDNLIIQFDSIKLYRQLHKYDANNLLIELINSDGLTSKFKYDSHHNLIELIGFYKNGEIVTKMQWKYTYDSFGNIIKSVEYRDSKPTTSFVRNITYYE